MASWGIAGGAAVKSYQDAEKLARDKQWEDQQRAEWARIRDQQIGMDNAVNGAEEAVDARYKVPEVGLPVDQMGQGLAPNVPEAKLDPTSVRAYTDEQGGVHPTSKAPPKQSEYLLEKAQRLKRSGTGAAGLKMAMELEQHAVGLIKQEQEQELTGILRMRAPAEQKIEALVKYIDDSPMVPGTASIVQGKDGLYLQHSVPGKKEPFRRKLEGSTPEEVVQNMALAARAMTDPSMAMKMNEYKLEKARDAETGRHHKSMEDIAREKAAQQAELARMRDATERALFEERQKTQQGNRANWQVLGQDDDGVAVSFDRSTNTMIRQDGKPPKNATKFWQKVTGEKPAAEYTPTETDAIKLWNKYKVDNPDASGAQVIAMGTRLNVPQALVKDPLLAAAAKAFGAPKPGLPAAKPAPVARAAPAVAKPAAPAAPVRGLPTPSTASSAAAIAGLEARLAQLDKRDPANVQEIIRLGNMINQYRRNLGN